MPRCCKNNLFQDLAIAIIYLPQFANEALFISESTWNSGIQLCHHRHSMAYCNYFALRNLRMRLYLFRKVGRIASSNMNKIQPMVSEGEDLANGEDLAKNPANGIRGRGRSAR
jgi:hypothetical protein